MNANGIKKELEKSRQEVNSYVQALDVSHEWNMKSKEYVEYLLQENQRYREALEFYAEGNHYYEDWGFDVDGNDEIYYETIKDKGEIARLALKEGDTE